MTSLEELCHGPPTSNFLQNLKGVSIKSCWEIQVAFQMNKLFEKVESRTSLLSNLTILQLFSLPKLEIIWKLKPSHRSIASLQSPKVASIEDCNKLKSIFSPSLALSMLHVQKLYIESYNCLEQVTGFVQGEITEVDILVISFFFLMFLISQG